MRSRKKSCLACVKAKTRCDLTYPSCSRCATKGLACEYEQRQLSQMSAARVPGGLPPQSLEAQSATSQNLAEQAAGQPLDLTMSSDLGGLFTPYELTYPFRPLQGQAIDSMELVSSDSSTWSMQPTDFLSGYIEDVTYPQPSPTIFGSMPHSSTNYLNCGMIDASLYGRVIPKAPKLFGLYTVQPKRLSLSRNFVICTLHSYPRMMLPGDSPPPFIHPQLGTETARDGRTIYQSLPRPLASCAAIMQMCSVKNEGNVLFIWRAIRMEQERFSLEV